MQVGPGQFVIDVGLPRTTTCSATEECSSTNRSTDEIWVLLSCRVTRRTLSLSGEATLTSIGLRRNLPWTRSNSLQAPSLKSEPAGVYFLQLPELAFSFVIVVTSSFPSCTAPITELFLDVLEHLLGRKSHSVLTRIEHVRIREHSH